MGKSQLREMKELEKENAQLKKIVAELALDKLILKESLGSLQTKGLTVENLCQTVIHARKNIGSSERQTCKTLSVSRSTQRYTVVKSKQENDRFRLVLIRLAKQ